MNDVLSQPAPTLSQATILVFLPTPARARIVPTHALPPIANRLRLGVGFAGRAHLLAALKLLAGPRCFSMRGGSFDPRRADKFLVELLHLEDQACRLIANRAPHLLEHLHAFALVLHFWIDLRITHQAHR